ncbi:MAG: hypothetical protein ACE3JN_08815 [Ectobacillus sp.]
MIWTKGGGSSGKSGIAETMDWAQRGKRPPAVENQQSSVTEPCYI